MEAEDDDDDDIDDEDMSVLDDIPEDDEDEVSGFSKKSEDQVDFEAKLHQRLGMCRLCLSSCVWNQLAHVVII